MGILLDLKLPCIMVFPLSKFECVKNPLPKASTEKDTLSLHIMGVFTVYSNEP